MALDRLAIDTPFKAPLHRWAYIDEALKAEDDLKARNHYNLFHQVVEAELKPHLKARVECEEHAVLSFASVWTSSKPGELVSWEADGQGAVGRAVEADLNQSVTSFEVYRSACEQVDWKGETFGIQRTHKKIECFEGTRLVTGLPVMPLRFKPSAAANSQSLSRPWSQI
jgi:hypothetical protein